MKKNSKILFAVTMVSILMAMAIICAGCVPTGQWRVTLDYATSEGTVTLSPEAEENIYEEGTVITVTVTPGTDYEVEKVMLGGSEKTLDDKGQFKFTVLENVTITVTFKYIGNEA